MSEQREAILAAMQRRAESVREQPAPGGLPEVDAPESWPHTFCDYAQARGFVTRVRANGSKEAEAIAQEFGVSVKSVRRAVANVLIHTGTYDPESWLAYQRKRKAEGRQRFLGYCRERDREKKERVVALAKTRSAVQEQRRVSELEIEELLAESELTISSPAHSPTRPTRGEKQRRLNARTRRYAGA